jgi:hypothetical protein
VQAVALQSWNLRGQDACALQAPWKSHAIGRSYPMVIELGKVAAKTKGMDVGLKLDNNVGAKVQRYSILF